MPVESEPVRLPSLDQLGRDLLHVTTAQRFVSILRPLFCVAGYFIFGALGWWVPAVACVAGLMFITYVSTSHDLLHRTLRFSPRWNDFWLSVIEGLTLRSGHAFRITHLCHHRHFPDHDDIEGRVARQKLWRALLEGVGNQTRLFAWAWRRARAGERRWMLVELTWVLAVWIASVAILPHTKILLVYVLLVTASSWLYPVATVWIPHRAEGKNVLFQTHALRGRWIPALFLQHTYHLEHHLYPSVSSFNWRKLAERLDPYLSEQGVKPFRTL